MEGKEATSYLVIEHLTVFPFHHQPGQRPCRQEGGEQDRSMEGGSCVERAKRKWEEASEWPHRLPSAKAMSTRRDSLC